MLRLTENQLRHLIRQILAEKIDAEKIRRQGSPEPGQTLGSNPAEDWTHYDTGASDTGSDDDSLDEDDAGEEDE